MKIVVIGGTGLIGSRLVQQLRQRGHEALPAAPSLGIDSVSGHGLAQAMDGAHTVVDVSNSPSFAPADVLAFFEASAANLAAAELRAGVKHHVALSVVGTDRAPDSGYLVAKHAQERIVEAAGVPFSIVRATQFFEFAMAIAGSATADGTVQLPTAAMQPIAADDVVAALADAVEAGPLNGRTDVAGPERLPMNLFVQRVLDARGDARPVLASAQARYFGAKVDDRSLVPLGTARLGRIRLADWLAENGTVSTA